MNNTEIFLLDDFKTKELITATKNSGQGWSRICLHQSSSSNLHAMIMCMLPGVKSGMHRHKRNFDIVTYAYLGFDLTIKVACDLDLNFNEVCQLNRTQSVLALPDNVFRSVENQSSEPIIYLEHRLGPYDRDEIIWL